MSACTFFGHRECYGLDTNVLRDAIESLIQQGTDTFYVGHQGEFDSIVLAFLKNLKREYPQITISVVLAYLPIQEAGYDLYADCSIYPEGLELCHLKFAIERRNRWMIAQSNYCICYITHTWGGAYKFAQQAKSKGLRVIDLGCLPHLFTSLQTNSAGI